MSDDFSGVKPPMRHISGVNPQVLQRAAIASQPAPQGVAEVMDQVSDYAEMRHRCGSHVYNTTSLAARGYIEQAITALVQERDALKSHIANLEALLEREFGSGWEDFDAAENRVLKARVAELEGDVARDAARYRWLRANRMEFGVQPSSDPGLGHKDYWWRVDWSDPVTQVDQRIDAAIAASKEAP